MTTVKLWQAAGMASVLEAVLVFGLVAVVATVKPPQPQPGFTPLMIEPLEAPLPVVEPPKKEPPPVIEPKPVEAPKPKPVIKNEPIVQQALPPEPIVTAEPVPEAIVEPPPVVVAKHEEVDPALAYNMELTRAVQAVFRVPGTAAAMGFKGRARVQFALKDAKVSAITLLESSTLGAVDRAALKAVEGANYPLPPDSLRGQLRSYQIWVECY